MTLWHAVWSHSVSTLLTEDRVAQPNMESTSTQSVNMWVCLCVYVKVKIDTYQRETEQRPDVCVKNRLLVQFSAAVCSYRSKYLPTQILLGLVNERLELWDLQEAEALCDGVQQQETISPANGRLQRSYRALLEENISSKSFQIYS